MSGMKTRFCTSFIVLFDSETKANEIEKPGGEARAGKLRKLVPAKVTGHIIYVDHAREQGQFDPLNMKRVSERC